MDTATGGTNDDATTVKCRVMVLGLTRPRVAKVMSLLRPMDNADCDALHLDIGSRVVSLDIEFLPCVATFGSYQDENGKNIRYLISVNYHGPNGASQAGSSLAPFFDEKVERNTTKKEDRDQAEKSVLQLGILGAAIGCGIEDDEDVQRILDLFQTLRGQASEPLATEVVQPNKEYDTMKEETEAFKNLPAEAKEEVTRLQTLGPGKMAKFITQFSKNLICKELQKREEKDKEESPGEGPRSTPSESELTNEPREIDSSKLRYACKKCRTILFGEDDMEDPPHVPAQHRFSARKVHHGGVGPGSCQSYFLTDSGFAWMGDMGAAEGRFLCPNTRCQTKLGTWHWAGAQCSCGTWVSPAVQIPLSKVDVVNPHHLDGKSLPAGSIVSPHVKQKLDQ